MSQAKWIYHDPASGRYDSRVADGCGYLDVRRFRKLTTGRQRTIDLMIAIMWRFDVKQGCTFAVRSFGDQNRTSRVSR